MTILEWYGQIGWDLWLPQLRAQLKNAKGEDITVRFSSIGGSIFEGSDIFNMIADHKRDNPNIQMNLEVKAIAASMASAIAASPAWDNITVESTSWLMIHNPSNIAWGDFRAMQDEADFLEKARDMWAAVYAAKSGDTLEDAQEMMNDTTWLFGQEIIDAGFADEMNDAAGSNDASGSNGVDKTVSMRQMKAKFAEMKKQQRDLSEDEGFDKQRAVACLRMSTPTMAVTTYKSNAKLIDTSWDSAASENRWRDHVGVESSDDLPKASYTKRFAYWDPEDEENFGAYKLPHWDHSDSEGEFVNIAAVRNALARLPQTDIPEDEKPTVESLLSRYLDRFNEEQDTAESSSNKNLDQTGMNQTEVLMDKAELKEKHPAIYDETVQGGVMIERARVKALTDMKALDEYKDIPEVCATIDKAIEDGKTPDEAQSLVMAVMVKIVRDPAHTSSIESPGDIEGSDPAPAMQTTEKIREV